jgi:hypothetical protein
VTAARDADGVTRARTWHEPGAAKVAVRGPGGEERSGTADVTAGGVATVRFDLAPGAPAAQAPSSGPPLGTWISWGVGAASLGAFAVFGGLALSASSQLYACAPTCPESLRPVASDGARDSLVANVALGVGAAALAAGAVIWIATPRRPAASPAARLSVSLSPGGGAAGLAFTF